MTLKSQHANNKAKAKPSVMILSNVILVICNDKKLIF